MAYENLPRDMLTSFSMTDEEFELFRTLVYRLIGINLNNTKKMLLVSRLSKRLRVYGFRSFMEYYRMLEAEGDEGQELGAFINQITTNKTDFFREEHHFRILAQRILPELEAKLANGESQNIRIWSAGCSTGEEPYTMAMVVADYVREHRLKADIKILATDIDTGVLEFAANGVYKHERMRGIPPEFVTRYFKVQADGSYEVSQELRSYIKFGRLNLMHRLPFRYGFDIIFCRNVLIYFTAEDRKALVKKYCTVMRPGAWLALGHSESLVTEGLPLKTMGPTLYQLVG